MESKELDAFLRGETDGRTFRHRDHLRMGFALLRRGSFTEAAAAYSAALKSIAARAGAPDAYHDTITVGFLALLAERIATDEYSDFEQFFAANADLADRQILRRWYRPERLVSSLARRTFILPEASL